MKSLLESFYRVLESIIVHRTELNRTLRLHNPQNLRASSKNIAHLITLNQNLKTMPRFWKFAKTKYTCHAIQIRLSNHTNHLVNVVRQKYTYNLYFYVVT